MAAGISVKLSLNDSLFQAGIKRASAAVADFGKTVAKVGFTTLAAAVAGSATAMIAGAKHVINLGDDLLRMKRITGLSVSSLFILREAFEQAGTSAEMIGPVVGKMQKSIYQASHGNKTLLKSFEGININVRKFSAMKPEQQFALLGKTINGLPDMQRQAVAMEIFGKAGLGLLPVFAELKDFDSKSLEKQAQVIEKNADAFDNANDAIRRMKTNFQGLFAGLATKLAPFIANIGKRLEEIDFVAWGDKIAEALMNGVRMGLALFNDPMGTMGYFWAFAKQKSLEFGNWLIDAIDSSFPGMGAAIISAINKTIAWKDILVGAAITFKNTLLAGLTFVIEKVSALWESSGLGNAMKWAEGLQAKTEEKLVGGMNAVRGFINKRDAPEMVGRIPGETVNQFTARKNEAMGANQFGMIQRGQGMKSGGAGRDFATILAGMGGAGQAQTQRGLDALIDADMEAAKGLKKFAGGADHLGAQAAQLATELAKNKIAPALKKADRQMEAVGLKEPEGKRGPYNPWHLRSNFKSVLKGAGPLNIGSLRGASLIDGMGAEGGGKSLRSSGMIWAREKRRQEAREKNMAAKGIDLTNQKLDEIKGVMANFGE